MTDKVKSLFDAVPQTVFETTHPSGHYYSAYPLIAEIVNDESRFFPSPPPRVLQGIDMREAAQVELCKVLAPLSQMDVPAERSSDWRYYRSNSWYNALDFRVLAGMMRHFKPNKIIEVGSGFSSAAMLDVRDRFLSENTSITCIEPFPERLNDLVGQVENKNFRMIDRPVQKVDISLFETLSDGDLCFIDSSHVSKVGSDLNHIMFEVLPRLKAGVVVHFHDILYPFDYPREWVANGFGWNEAYVLRAFLQYNLKFEILFYNSFMTTFHADLMRESFPDGTVSGGIYLRCVDGGSR